MFGNKESLSYLMVVWENSQVFKYHDIVDNNKKKQSKQIITSIQWLISNLEKKPKRDW